MKTFILLSLLATASLQALPAQSHARARHVIARHGQSVDVEVHVDITAAGANAQPEALGAYVASISFDPRKVELMEVRGAASGAFAAAPAATERARANESGLVKLAAAQSDPDGPTGDVAVAYVLFRERTAGGASTIHTHIDSAAGTHRTATGLSVVTLATE
jgi:hypothetical protein